MPEYLSPGVYIEEFDAGAKPIEGVSTSTAGMLGLTERGPSDVRLVTSFEQYQRIYGGFIENSYLTYAVDGFFRNGGKRCFIGRVVCDDADAASLSLTDGSDTVTFDAVGDGEWGNRIAIRIENSSANPDEPDTFKLIVAYWNKAVPSFEIQDSPPLTDAEKARALRELLETAAVTEVFDDLSSDSGSSDFFEKRVNGISNLISITGSGRPANTASAPAPVKYLTPLTGGFDSTDSPPECEPARGDFLGDVSAPPGQKRGLTAFEEVDEISILYVPDIHVISDAPGRKALVDDILAQCEKLKDRFAVFETPKNTANIPNLKITQNHRPSKYGAIYYPWIKVFDPLTERDKLVPPGGHIVGIYARSDQERGVHKAPANEIVRGASAVEFQITKGEQDILNPRGINVIRVFPGRGIRVWGARNMILDALWKYINVRRLFIFVEESIEEGTQFLVFEPNNEKLWDRVILTISQFLERVWRDGALMGTSPDEAFFVKCDRTTMTQDDIDNGRLICIIGIAPVKPAEFVIFRITQTKAGADISEL